MSHLLTIPHLSWLQRLSLALGMVLASLGTLFVLAWAMQWEAVLQFGTRRFPVPPTGALGLALLGYALVGYLKGFRRAALLALIPAGLGLAGVLSRLVPSVPSLDELLVPNAFGRGLPAPRIHPIAGSAFFLAGLAFAGFAARRVTLIHTLALAFTASIFVSVAFSTLLGYGFGLPVVYRWGMADILPLGAAVMILVAGIAFLALAWREHQGDAPGAPGWIPLPVMVGAATLSCVIWMSLREAERISVASTTHAALRDYAGAIGRELDHQRDQTERLALRWTRAPGDTLELNRDAATLRGEILGCEGVAHLDEGGHTLWESGIQGSSLAAGVDQSAEPVRRAALDRARESRRPQFSASLLRSGAPAGYAVYVPILHEGAVAGFVGADISYRRLFGILDGRLKLTGGFATRVYVGGDLVYEGRRDGADKQTLEEVFDVADRRIRIALAPTRESLQQTRRHLPEFALGAGIGITLLLGLSVHFARAARSGLRAARISNLRLVAENEERRRVEEMLKISDEQLRLALDSTQIGIFEWKLATNHLFCSASIWNMLGYPPGMVPPTLEAWTSLLHPDDVPAFRLAMEKQLHGQASFVDPEYRMRTQSGEWKWLYSRSRAVTQTSSGTPLRIIGTLQDVTARKLAEEALRHSQAATRKLSLVASKTDNLVVIAACDGTIEWVNESFERVMDYALAEVAGRNPAGFLIGPETAAQTVRRIRLALHRGEGISTDVVCYSKSGRKYYLHLEIQPVRSESGALENFIAVMADISARVETEQTLRRAKAEADAASKAKSEFLASMSHEIRTPMNGVIGMTSLLLDTPLNHEQRDCVNTIRTSGEALLTIINDILDFSKIESGRLELERLPFELAVCVEDALDLFSAQAAEKKLELVYAIERDVPAWIQGDATRLRQVLVNLVNNAVKFTPAGTVAVEVRRLTPAAAGAGREGAEHIVLQFSVTDSGIGIPSDRLDRLFRPFSQVDSSTTRKYGGTGLGLAICHRLCGLMGGTITVRSTMGVGSTFVFTVQTETVATPLGWGLPELPVRLNYGPTLCIEDEPVTQRRLETFLSTWGARPVCAASAEAALEQLASDTPPVAILLDCGLPENEAGIELRARICGTGIPTVLLVPPGQSGDDLEVFAGRRGITTVSKPARTHALLRGIQGLFDAPIDSLPPFSMPADAQLLAREIPLEVLVVEDNAVNQKVALRFLDRLGYRADAVGNGVEALNTLQARRYHLVLMDLQMPEMDGFEATRQIRKRVPAERQPKIIALTANALRGDRELCLAAGMDDYITKPVKLLDIAHTIRRQFTGSSRPPQKSGAS